MNKGTKVC